MSSQIENIFGPEGIIAKNLPGYEPRPDQINLSKKILECMINRQHLIGEAPCGVGKSFAYSVPAFAMAKLNPQSTNEDLSDEPKPSQKPIVIATANIVLQEQLIAKDMPFLQSIFKDWGIEVVLVKGRNNYVCNLKAGKGGEYTNKEFRTSKGFPAEQHNAIEKYAFDCMFTKDFKGSGDKSELDFIPDERVWSAFSITENDCIGQDCEFYYNCFCNVARKKMEKAHIIIVNYHLLFLDQIIKYESGGAAGVLPDYDFLICDEGHRIIEIARDFLGFDISKFKIKHLISALKDTKMIPDSYKKQASDLHKKIMDASESFFNSLERFYGGQEYNNKRLTVSEPVEWLELNDLITQCAHVLTDVAVTLVRAGDNDSKVYAKRLERRAETMCELSNNLSSAMLLNDTNMIVSLERTENGNMKLIGKPFDVSDKLKEIVWDRTKSTTIVSATLAVNNNFDYICKRIGFEPDQNIITDSPFNFSENAALVIPQELPDPTPQNADIFQREFFTILEDVIDASNGSALVLFTSYRHLNAVKNKWYSSNHTTMYQGDAPRIKLIERFKTDVNSVLMATASFWEGVDVPGESLVLLVIDKMPFPSPADPIMDAISDESSPQYDPRWFFNESLPRAVLSIKQGAGRLIRHRNDYGVIMLCDKRILHKGYGQMVLKSLPSMPLGNSYKDVGEFLKEKSAISSGSSA